MNTRRARELTERMLAKARADGQREFTAAHSHERGDVQEVAAYERAQIHARYAYDLQEILENLEEKS